MAESDEWTVQEMIELELVGILAIIDTHIEEFGHAPIKYTKVRDQLASLQRRLNAGEIQPEYAEIEIENISNPWKR